MEQELQAVYHFAFPARKQKEGSTMLPSTFSQCKISAQAMALPTVRLGLLLSVNPIYRLAPRYDQMLVS